MNGEKYQADASEVTEMSSDSSKRLLTELERKHKDGEQLTKEDLVFLYEVDSKIQGFGWKEEPRIDEIIKGRDAKEDLSLAMGIPKEKISTTKEEALSGDILYHYGDLDLNDLTTVEELKLPKIVSGELWLDNLTTAERLVLPESVGGGLYMQRLTTAKGVKFPESVGGDLWLARLTTTEGLVLPKSVGGDLWFADLTTTEGLVLPKSIGGSLYLRGPTTAEGLVLPESVGNSLVLSGLTTAKGIKFPESIGGYLDLIGLTSLEGLILPEDMSVTGIFFSRALIGEREEQAFKEKYPQYADKIHFG